MSEEKDFETKLLAIKKKYDDIAKAACNEKLIAVRSAYFEGWNDGLISPNSTEEDQQDDWLLSKSFREIATKGE